jgi:alpha-mannosidase
VYPTWELDEAWRELLAAQHHDNHECEGLCGFVAYHQMDKAFSHANEVFDRTLSLLSDRAGAPLLHNALGWSRSLIRLDPLEGLTHCGRVPPFGFVDLSQTRSARSAQLSEEGDRFVLSFGPARAVIDNQGTPTVQLFGPSFPHGALSPDWSPRLESRLHEQHAVMSPREASLSSAGLGIVDIDIAAPMHHRLRPTTLEVAMRGEGLEVVISDIGLLVRPDAGLGAAWKFPIEVGFEIASIRADSPMSVSAVRGSGRVRRKYPSGDWMTSSQWFEELSGAITAHSFVDLLAADGSGLLIVHDGSQQFFRTERGLEAVICAYDPWDEGRFEKRSGADARLLLLPHGPMRDVERVKLAREFELESAIRIEPIRPAQPGLAVGGGMRPQDHPVPPMFAPMDVAGDDTILCHAFYRENPKAGENLPFWAGHTMREQSEGACTHPFVVRLIEWDGISGEAVLRFAGEIASAAKTNIMGEIGEQVGGGEDTGWLTTKPCESPAWINGCRVPGGWHEIRVPMKPREIATVMVDLVLGRKEWRDLDAKRKEWATIHRVDGPGGGGHE